MKASVDIEIANLKIKDVLSLTPAELGSFITGVMAYYDGAESQEFVDNIRDGDFNAAAKIKLEKEAPKTTTF